MNSELGFQMKLISKGKLVIVKNVGMNVIATKNARNASMIFVPVVSVSVKK